MLFLCVFANTQITDDVVYDTNTFLNFCRASSRCIELNEVVESDVYKRQLFCLYYNKTKNSQVVIA